MVWWLWLSDGGYGGVILGVVLGMDEWEMFMLLNYARPDRMGWGRRGRGS